MKVTCKDICLFFVATATMLAASCSSFDSDPWSDFTPGGGTSPSGGQSDAASMTLPGTLGSFTVAVDSTALAESEVVPSDDTDYWENNSFASTIYIRYAGSQATVEGSAEGVEVSTDGAYVTVRSTAKGVEYVLSGTTTEGCFRMEADDNAKKFKLTLNGVNIHHDDGPAINIQTGKRCYLHVADGTYNSLSDGTTYAESDEDRKATLFSEGELLFSGAGRLRVWSNARHGICSDDYIQFRPNGNVYVKSTSGHCVKSNDGIYVLGGVLNCETSATASKGMKTDGEVQISGGRVTCITTGAAQYDADEGDCTGAAGVKSDMTFTMTGGTLSCMSTGAGGKGISSDGDIDIEGGTVRIVTTGARYTYGRASSSPKGIKGDANVLFAGGDVMVRSTGGDGAEGIESKAQLVVTGGQVASYAYDDAINASTHIEVTGGMVYAVSSANDGIDSNGTLTVTGGVVVACGTDDPEDGFDCDQNTFTITGGTLVGIGGGTSMPTSSTTKQPTMVVGGVSLTSGQYLSLSASDGSGILALALPRSYSAATVLLSSPKMQTGSTYSLGSGTSAQGGTDSFMGFLSSATVAGATTQATVSLTSMVTTYNYSSQMGGGGGTPPGGGGGGGMPPGGGGAPW